MTTKATQPVTIANAASLSASCVASRCCWLSWRASSARAGARVEISLTEAGEPGRRASRREKLVHRASASVRLRRAPESSSGVRATSVLSRVCTGPPSARAWSTDSSQRWRASRGAGMPGTSVRGSGLGPAAMCQATTVPWRTNDSCSARRRWAAVCW